MVRAWVGGFGYAKVGANYGPSLLATQEARDRGYGQVLWLYGPDALCTEAGASNFFVVLRCPRTARPQLLTAPLDDRLILDGVTRRSLLQLARERLGPELDVVERRYGIAEVLRAAAEGRLLEAFAAGTAVSKLIPPGLRFILSPSPHTVPTPPRAAIMMLTRQLCSISSALCLLSTTEEKTSPSTWATVRVASILRC